MTGVHLPFFTVWLKAIGIDATWIGIITAVPPVTRFTILRWSHRRRNAPDAAWRDHAHRVLPPHSDLP